MTANLKKQEEILAYQKLGGKTEGQPQETKKEEIDPVEYAENALKGKM